MAISYRAFRNPDPPALVRIWNESLAGRGAAFLQGTTPLEHYVLAKPYFEPTGILIAEEDGTPVGFVHAGHGPDATGQRLALDSGIICLLAVLPSHRGRGIGSELLHRAEGYLKERGACRIQFGDRVHCHPFYWGIYGGSEPGGVLASDPSAEPFLVKNRYTVAETRLVLQRSLEEPLTAADARFAAIRKQTELRVVPRPSSDRWFVEASIGPLEMLYFGLQDNASSAFVASARVWDMDLFGWRWHQPAAGVVDLEVLAAERRRGLGKFLVIQALRYLQDQFFTLVEAQVSSENAAALALFHGLGFQDVDEARVYRLGE